VSECRFSAVILVAIYDSGFKIRCQTQAGFQHASTPK